MLPFRDANPAERFPIVTVAIIALNVGVFIWELTLGPRVTDVFAVYGIVPRRITEYAQWSRGDPVAAVQPFVTSMFLHGGWMHLIGNMWYLWIFGDNVEDRLGRLRYVLFYLIGGLGAGALHVAANPMSPVPTVGASGAIAAVLGGYLVVFPRARVATLVPLGFYVQIAYLPAFIVLGFWFVIQLFSGLGSLGGRGLGGGIAWWAHAGGFVVGAALIVLLGGLRSSPRRPPRLGPGRRERW